VLDALVANGANQINGPSFGIDKPEPLYDRARIEALKLAQARAETYAKALGLRVRRIVSIGEGGAGMPVPMPRMGAMKAEAFDSPPGAPGEGSVSVSRDVVFGLARGVRRPPRHKKGAPGGALPPLSRGGQNSYWTEK